MNEYISKKYLEELLDYYLNNSNGAERYGYNIIKGEIGHVPIADVKEVVHGEWLVENGNIVCSVCHAGKPTINGYEMLICDGEKFVSMERTNFCGNCGAKMGKEN
jgi:hypothetical protein